jgi:GNAT superfamily N-acetyltransferase
VVSDRRIDTDRRWNPSGTHILDSPLARTPRIETTTTSICLTLTRLAIHCLAVDIRTLLPPPWPLLAPLLEASSKEGFQFLIRLEDEYLSGKVRFNANGETLLGSFKASTLFGVGGLTRDPYCDDPHTGRVRHLYVLPQWRGRGIGASLLSAIELHAEAHFKALVLRTDTAAGAAFFQSHGYELLASGGTATHRRLLLACG